MGLEGVSNQNFESEEDLIERMSDLLYQTREEGLTGAEKSELETLKKNHPIEAEKALRQTKIHWYTAKLLKKEEQEEFEDEMDRDPFLKRDFEIFWLESMIGIIDDLSPSDVEKLSELTDKYPIEAQEALDRNEYFAMVNKKFPKEVWEYLKKHGLATEEPIKVDEVNNPDLLFRRFFHNAMTSDQARQLVEGIKSSPNKQIHLRKFSQAFWDEKKIRLSLEDAEVKLDLLFRAIYSQQ
jgi:uncharacterized protein YnzC (UPF0291/DUF896 family)